MMKKQVPNLEINQKKKQFNFIAEIPAKEEYMPYHTKINLIPY